MGRIGGAGLRASPERERAGMARRSGEGRLDFELLGGGVAREVVAPREAEVRSRVVRQRGRALERDDGAGAVASRQRKLAREERQIVLDGVGWQRVLARRVHRFAGAIERVAGRRPRRARRVGVLHRRV